MQPFFSHHWLEVVIWPPFKSKRPWEVLESKHLQMNTVSSTETSLKMCSHLSLFGGVVIEGVLGNLYFQELESSYTLDLSYYMEFVLSLDTQIAVAERHRYKRTFL